MKHFMTILVIIGGTNAFAVPFTFGSFLVSNGHSREVFEYTREGALVQTISVPYGPGQDSSDFNRDMVLDSRGNLQVFNGTFHPTISTFDPYQETWTHHEIPGLSTIGAISYGKLAVFSDYIFATDHATGTDEDGGIFRLNIIDGTWVRFALKDPNDEATDLTMGGDGLLYSLNHGRYTESFNPVTLDLVAHTDLPDEFVWGIGHQSISIAVDSSRNYYINQVHGPIYELSPSLDVIGEFSYTASSFGIDLDRAIDGQTMITQDDGRVCILDSAFKEINTFVATGPYSTHSFGAFVQMPVPEPVHLFWASSACLCLLIPRRRPVRDSRRTIQV